VTSGKKGPVLGNVVFGVDKSFCNLWTLFGSHHVNVVLSTLIGENAGFVVL
jgi:hypothetical protein